MNFLPAEEGESALGLSEKQLYYKAYINIRRRNVLIWTISRAIHPPLLLSISGSVFCCVFVFVFSQCICNTLNIISICFFSMLKTQSLFLLFPTKSTEC